MMAIVPLIGLSLLAAAAMPAAAQATVQAADRGAIAAQAQTAWFAGDDAALGRAAASANGLATSSKPQDRYTQGFVQFRILQRAIGANRDKDAERAGAVCIAATEAAVKAEPKFAEAFALQSACYGYLANLGGLGAIRNGSRSGKAIEAALALEPRHPRVQLVDGFGLYFRPAFVGGDQGKGWAAAAAFDAAGPAGAGGAGGIEWGAAEAHFWVGRCAREAGDATAAQRSFERALTLAPGFVAARRALGR
jgi:tetratricopeptide (TPR) repeat protein